MERCRGVAGAVVDDQGGVDVEQWKECLSSGGSAETPQRMTAEYVQYQSHVYAGQRTLRRCPPDQHLLPAAAILPGGFICRERLVAGHSQASGPVEGPLGRRLGIPTVVDKSTGGLAGRRNDPRICMGHSADHGNALGLCVQDLRLAGELEQMISRKRLFNAAAFDFLCGSFPLRHGISAHTPTLDPRPRWFPIRGERLYAGGHTPWRGSG
jgi:hypothetical protein